jgi:hypothetical protein
MARSYLETTAGLYREAALDPQKGLCCTTAPVWKLPGLKIPKRMLEYWIPTTMGLLS